ncbi:MAG: transglutaminase domain-containing protein [Phycisphaerales bacterium]
MTLSPSLILRLLLIAGALAFTPAANAAGADGDVFERWYILEMQGSRAGWSRIARERTADDNYITINDMHLEIARADQIVRISMSSTFEETPDGEPVRLVGARSLGAGKQMDTYVFNENGVSHTVEERGRRTEQDLPLPEGEWLTPREVEAYVRSRLAAGAEEIAYATLDPAAGFIVYRQTHTITARNATTRAQGRKFDAIRWKVTQELTPDSAHVEWVDNDGRLIRSRVNFGGLRLETILSDRKSANAPVMAPELMVSTLVRPDRRITRPRAVREAVYRLTASEGEMPDLPSAGAQRVERIDEQTVRVTVNLDDIPPASKTDIDDDAYRGATPMIDAAHPDIVALAEEVTDPMRDVDVQQRAEALRRHVNAFISEKNLGVGFASATEVCATGEGDCSEHAVLLAALLRADNIPSRVASGLLYIDRFAGEREIFGYHMWTQALVNIDGEMRWIDLDATLPENVPTDATHIALSYTSLAEGDLISSMSTLATLMGRLTISVESTD